MQVFIEKLNAILRINHLKVSKKLLLLTLLFLSVISAMVIYTMLTLDAQKDDATVINIAGRQRMLTQKFTKEFFLSLQHSNQQKTQQQLTNTNLLFEQSLTALTHGGFTYLDLKMEQKIKLPATTNEKIKSKLGEVSFLWQKLQTTIEKIDVHHFKQAQLNSVNQLSIEVLIKMNQAVFLFADASDSKVQNMVKNQIWIWLIASLAASLCALVITQNITTPLSYIVNATQRISDGDLKAFPKEQAHRDELGKLIEQIENMRSVLSSIIHTVQQNSKQMTHSSLRIATISNEISSISAQEKEGSAKVLSATDSLQHITSTVSEHISHTHKTADKNQQTAANGIQVVQQSIDELTSAVTSVNSTAKQMASVQAATDKINSIIESIDNLASQTNLLALNAAIEAARAGEHGRGFAVVADEVGNLASRTAESTTEITSLISELTASVENSVQSMKLVTKQVNQSQQQSQKTLNAFEDMANGINENSNSFAQVAELNDEQRQKLSSLQVELSQLFDVLSVSTEKADSTSLVANDLHISSDKLDKLLSDFETDDVTFEQRKQEEKRAYPRIDNQIKVIISQGDRDVEGLSQDISMTGLQIKCLNSLLSKSEQTQNKQVTVCLHIPQQGINDKVESIIVDSHIIRETKKPDGYYYGIAFNQMNNSQQEKIKKLFKYFSKASHYA